MKKLSFLLVASLLLSGCGLFVSEPAPTPTTTVSPPITFTPVPTMTATMSPTATSTPVDTSTTATSTPTSAPTTFIPPKPESSKDLTTYRVAMVDPIGDYTMTGTFGCGDKVVIVDLPPTEKPTILGISLLKTLNGLFAVKESEFQYQGKALLNSLAGSNVKVNDVEILNGAAKVEINGTIISAGTCDDPRIKEQIIQTIMNYPKVTSYTILLNGSTKEWECLGDQSGNCI